LVQMINSPSLPNAPMTRWVAFIQLFSFDIVHKPGKTFTLPNALSRRPISRDKEEFYEDQEDLDKEAPLIRPCYQFQICSLTDSLEDKEWEAPGYWRQL
jgi:hypothetical protein